MNKKIGPAILVLLGLAVYAPALRAGFVWDDRALVLADPLIRSWRLIWESFQHFLFTDAGGSEFYRPVQRLTYLVDYAAFIFAPGGYHLVSILWHAAAAVALFFLGDELLGFCGMHSPRRTWLAFLAAVAWLVHPVQSAAVAYVSGRADPLAAAFGFSGLFLGLRMLRTTGARKWWLGFAVGFCLLASALSKEMGLLFLLLWLVLVLAQKRRSEILGAAGIVVAVLVIYLSLRLPAERPPPHAELPPAPLLVRPIVVARAAAEYAGLLIFPRHLHMDRDVETRPTGFDDASLARAAWRELQTLLGLLLIAGALFALWRARRRTALFLPLLLALLCYLPISGLVSLNATVAEHWLYLPSAFLFLGLAVVVDSLGGMTRRGLVICVAVWLVFLPVRTFLRCFDWHDQRIFLTRTIAEGGDSARMWINLGNLELSEGHLPAAQQAFARAIAKDPDSPLALLGFGTVAMKQRDFPRARLFLQKITTPPDIAARAIETLAVLENRETGSVNFLRLRLAARTGASNWSIEKHYIKALADSGFPDRAITELKTCLGVAPYRAESWLMMSEVLQRIQRPNEAALALAEAEANDVHLHQHE